MSSSSSSAITAFSINDELDDVDYEKVFGAMANRLLKGSVLVVGSKHRFLISEIEFYLKSRAHDDPFTHGVDEQQRSCRWYFHRQGHSYRGGTYKGLDVTFGNDNAAGGILIRSVLPIDARSLSVAQQRKSLIQGPCCVVNRILELLDVDSVQALVDTVLGGNVARVDDVESQLRIETRRADDDHFDVVRSARVGLNLTKRNVPLATQLDYVMRRYRYATFTRALAKGRALLVAGCLVDGTPSNRLAERVNTSNAVLQRWVGLYRGAAQLSAADALAKARSFESKRLSENDAIELFASLLQVNN
jgi:3-methyladenine DNA glycosylase Mpg